MCWFRPASIADELVIMIRGIFGSTNAENLQVTLDLVSNWCQSKERNINPRKQGLAYTFPDRTVEEGVSPEH